MRYYSVHRSESNDGSHGYVFFASKREALKHARMWMRQSSDEGGVYDATVTTIVVTPTKTGILFALNKHASHADNG